MLFLWILGILVLLLLLICLLRIRILVEADQAVTLKLRIGPIIRQLYPTIKKNEPKPEKQSNGTEKKRTIPKPTVSDLRDAYYALKPAVIKALRRTRRSIRIYPLDITVILGGRTDPAETAETYGYASAAVWTLMPALEQLLTIPDPRIHLDMDFEAEKTRLHGSVGVDIRIGALLMIALDAAIPAIRWLFKYMKKPNNATKQPLSDSAA